MEKNNSQLIFSGVPGALHAATIIAGSVTNLSKKIGVKPSTMYQWIKEIREVPAIRAVRIEIATGVDRRFFRPRDWIEYWPELVIIPNKPIPQIKIK